MKDYRKSSKFTLGLVYFFMLALVAFSVALPFITNWYVEIRGKDPRLATTIMTTCYPCAAIAAVALLAMRKIIVNVIAGLILGDENIKLLRTVAICLFAVAIFTTVMGFRYMPFFIVGFSAASCGMITLTFKTMFDTALQLQREKEFESVRKFYEEDNNIGNR